MSKEVKRTIKITCPECHGEGQVLVNDKKIRCIQCRGIGEIQEIVVEIVQEDNLARAS